jgi:hypothetical protein
VARIRLTEVGVSSAAPAAWITRKTSSMARLVDNPQAAEAKVKTSTPIRKPFWRLRPSDRRPNRTRSEA